MLLILLFLLSSSASAGERQSVYDERGRYQGYVSKNPYSGRCCSIYDKQGKYVGKLGDSYTGKGNKNGKRH